MKRIFMVFAIVCICICGVGCSNEKENKTKDSNLNEEQQEVIIEGKEIKEVLKEDFNLKDIDFYIDSVPYRGENSIVIYIKISKDDYKKFMNQLTEYGFRNDCNKYLILFDAKLMRDIYNIDVNGDIYEKTEKLENVDEEDPLKYRKYTVYCMEEEDMYKIYMSRGGKTIYDMNSEVDF